MNTLYQRTKSMKVKDNLKINDTVLVKDENSPPSHWPLAKITAIHPGNDQLVRVVTVRMRIGKDLRSSKATSIKMGEFKRAVTKMICLPREPSI